MSAIELPAGWPVLDAGLADHAITPADKDSYRLRRSSYMKVGSPALILLPTDASEVAAALVYASAVRAAVGEVGVSIRSGGHGFAGGSTNAGGLLIDLSALNAIDVVDPAAGLLHAQAGAVWGDVAAALAPHDLALTSGNFGDTGVGGLATAGGVGFLARSSGLTIDRVRAATVVTPDGVVHQVDAEHEPELFWAIRGGLTQAGVVTDFTFEATRVGSANGDATIIQQSMQQVVESLPEFTQAWGEALRNAPRELTSFLRLQSIGDGRIVVGSTNVWANDDAGTAEPVLSALADLAPLAQHEAYLIPYASAVPAPRWPHTGQQRIGMRDAVVYHVDAAVGEALAEALGNQTVAVGELRSLGGAVGDLPVDATAMAHRSAEAMAAGWVHPVSDDKIDAAWQPIQQVASGIYAGYTSDTRPQTAELVWPGATGERLRAISNQVDPNRLLNAGLVLPR